MCNKAVGSSTDILILQNCTSGSKSTVAIIKLPLGLFVTSSTLHKSLYKYNMCAIMSGLVAKFAYSKLSRMLAPLVNSGIYYDISNISVSNCVLIFLT